MSVMDLFDSRILTVLKDGGPRDFQQLLSQVRFSHNILRLHLASLERQGFILEAKKVREGPRRPSFVYSLPPEIKHWVALTLRRPYTAIVSLTFRKLRHLCRFEKGDTARKRGEDAKPQNCPQILKGQ